MLKLFEPLQSYFELRHIECCTDERVSESSCRILEGAFYFQIYTSSLHVQFELKYLMGELLKFGTGATFYCIVLNMSCK